MQKKNKKKIVIGILCCMLVFMGIGYAALSQVLDITTTAKVTGKWNVYISSAIPSEKSDTELTATEVTDNKTTDISLNVNFKKPGDYITYDITVKNEGTIDAKLDSITMTPPTNVIEGTTDQMFMMETKNLTKDSLLKAGEETTFQMTVSFNEKATSLPSSTDIFTFELKLNYVQANSSDMGTSGTGGGATIDTESADFTVDSTGKIVAYNESKVTIDADGYLVVPATNSEGKVITKIDSESFVKSNITTFYSDEDEGIVIDAATEEEYLELKAIIEQIMNEDGSGSGSGSGSSYSSGSGSMSKRQITPEIKKLNNIINPEILKVSGSGLGSESGSGTMTIYWSKEKEIPQNAEIEKYYLNKETGKLEDSLLQFTKIDLTQAMSLEEISDDTFGKRPLASIKFNEGLKKIGAYAFNDSELSGPLELPNSLESIGDWAFSGNQITSLEIPSIVTTIGNGAFNSNQITSLVVPSSVTSIGYEAFSGNQIKNLELPNSLITIGYNAFGNNQIKNLELPNSLTTIGNWSFSGNQITSLIIPSSVTSIGDGAFSENSNLKTITIKRASNDGMSLGTNWNGNATIVYDPS